MYLELCLYIRISLAILLPLYLVKPQVGLSSLKQYFRLILVVGDIFLHLILPVRFFFKSPIKNSRIDIAFKKNFSNDNTYSNFELVRAGVCSTWRSPILAWNCWTNGCECFKVKSQITHIWKKWISCNVIVYVCEKIGSDEGKLKPNNQYLLVLRLRQWCSVAISLCKSVA